MSTGMGMNYYSQIYLGTEENEVYKDIEEDVERQLVFDAINRLKRREREIMYMRFGLMWRGSVNAERGSTKT